MERAIGYATGSWWASARVAGPAQAQQDLDRWCERVADQRARPDGETVATLAAGEPLRALPAQAYPAQIRVERVASRSALVAYDGNRYSIAPAHAGRTVTVLGRVGDPQLRIIAATGEVIGEHRQAPAGAGQTIRTAEHAQLLEQAVLAAFTTEKTCARKRNRPPSDTALAALAAARGLDGQTPPTSSLQAYAQLAEAC